MLMTWYQIYQTFCYQQKKCLWLKIKIPRNLVRFSLSTAEHPMLTYMLWDLHYNTYPFVFNTTWTVLDQSIFPTSLLCIPNFEACFCFFYLDLAAAFSSALAPLPSPRPGGTWHFVNRTLKFQLTFQRIKPHIGFQEPRKGVCAANRWDV